MAAEPASVQERWFARLYLLKSLVFAVFSLFWIATGLISLGPEWEVGMIFTATAVVAQPVTGVLLARVRWDIRYQSPGSSGRPSCI
jgi:hypothetical protein